MRRSVAGAGLVVVIVGVAAVLLITHEDDSPTRPSEPTASPAPPAPESLTSKHPLDTRRRAVDRRVRRFMDLVYRDLIAYWTPETQRARYGTPHVKRRWPRRGERVATACGVTANQDSAFYCSGDDTIYIGQRLASDVWRNRVFPARKADEPPLARKVGDFGLAFIVAHEYAHGLGQVVGTRRYNPTDPTKSFELAADCAAGVWGANVMKKRKVPARALRVARTTASHVGDTAFRDPNHHGTPRERRRAWETGFRAKTIAGCNRYLTNPLPTE